MNRAIFPTLCMLLAACSSTNTPPTTTQDAGTDTPAVDAPVEVDGATADTPAPQDVPPADVPMTSRCGTAQPDVSSISNTEGLVIGPDGTIYFSQSNAVGRLRPGMAVEPTWVAVTASTMWGLAIDPSMNRLYVGSPANGTIYKVDMASDPPMVSRFIGSAGQPNGLTLGTDGALWYTDFGGGHVYRVTADGTKTRVTTSTIAGADGIAFAADGSLLVTSYNAGTVVRLTLDSNMETARAVVARGLSGPDGLNLDAMGRMYVGGGGRVVRLDADGSNPMTLMMGAGSGVANVEFGVGALPCTDLYVARSGALLRISVDTPGADVPWHRAP